MRVGEAKNLASYCEDVAERAQVAATALVSVTAETKVAWLRAAAALLRGNHQRLTAANELDLAEAPNYGLTEAQIDRLRLTPDRIEAIAVALEEVADLPEPIGQVIESTIRPNGLVIDRVRVPLGVVFFIYESRPNVTADAAAICVKSGNAVILRGGKEAMHSSQADRRVAPRGRARSGAARRCRATRVDDRSRRRRPFSRGCPSRSTSRFPAAAKDSIRRVAEEARMPVIKHFAGNCHVYVDRDADLEMAERSCVNAKCQRMGVCNAAESLLVHADVAAEFFPRRPWPNSISTASKSAATPGPANWLPRRCPPAKRIMRPSISARSFPSRSSIRSTKRSTTSIDIGSHHTDAIVTDDVDAAREFATARRQLGRDDQCQHAVQRRRRVRPRRRDRHQHRQVPRPRSLRGRTN